MKYSVPQIQRKIHVDKLYQGKVVSICIVTRCEPIDLKYQGYIMLSLEVSTVQQASVPFSVISISVHTFFSFIVVAVQHMFSGCLVGQCHCNLVTDRHHLKCRSWYSLPFRFVAVFVAMNALGGQGIVLLKHFTAIYTNIVDMASNGHIFFKSCTQRIVMQNPRFFRYKKKERERQVLGNKHIISVCINLRVIFLSFLTALVSRTIFLKAFLLIPSSLAMLLNMMPYNSDLVKELPVTSLNSYRRGWPLIPKSLPPAWYPV